MNRTVIHCLAAALIVAASMAIWHWRFIVDPGALPETRLEKPLVGWTSAPNEQHEMVTRDGEAILLLQRKSPKEKPAGVRIWYGPLEHVKYVHIRCESRWKDVVPGQHSWLIARFAAHMRDANGNVSHPPGSLIFGGYGSSDWKKSEIVLKLTEDMVDTGFAIAMTGKSGTLEVRNLTMVAVRQRGWVPAATIFAVLGGIALCTSLIRSHSKRPDFARSLVAAMVLVTATWILVFPQTKGFLHPIPGTFSVGDPNTPPPEPKPTIPAIPVTKPAPPSQQARPPTKPSPPPAIPEPAPPKVEPHAPPEPESRDSGDLHRAINEIDKRFGPAHIFLFTGLTLLILIITGRDSQWRLPLALAFLAEIVPELTDHLGGWDDWADLISNIAGVGIAVLLWLRLPLLKRFHIQSAERNTGDPQ